MKNILVTGSAGFIGANLVMRLLETPGQVGGDGGLTIVGLDNMNDYYDVSLKEYRLRKIEERFAELSSCPASPERSSCPASLERSSCPASPGHLSYTFVRGSIADKALVDRLFEEYHFDIVVNLAAQAGVRYSIENPDVYIESNIIGFYNILEACRHHPVEHLVYASSSSVYGGNKKVPFAVEDRVDNPVSLYAATKKSNELMAHCYSKLYDIPSTGLRFFTVYGPAGRPDMAYFGFTNKLLAGGTIQIFNYGNCRRDFTYVDDIVEGIVRVMAKAPARTPGQAGSDGGSQAGSDGGSQAGSDGGSQVASDGRSQAGSDGGSQVGSDGGSQAGSDGGSQVGSDGGSQVASDGGIQVGSDVMPDPDRASIPYAVYNIGGGQPENLLDFVNILQEELVAAGVLPADYDFEAHKQLVPMQPGDVPTTYADSTALERDFGFTPRITLREGLRKFAHWYKEYYG